MDDSYSPLGDSSDTYHGDTAATHDGLSWQGAATMQCAIILGLGVLGLPWAISTMGWFLGIFSLLLAALGGVYSGHTLHHVILRVTELAAAKGDGPPRKFRDLGFYTWGEQGREVVEAVQATFLAGAIVAVQLTASKSLQQVVHSWGGDLCLVSANVIIALSVLPFMQFRHLKEATWMAVLSVAFIALALVLYMVELEEIVEDSSHNTVSKDSGGTSLGFPTATSDFNIYTNGLTTIVFAYQGQTIFPEIIAEMSSPSDFPRALHASVLFMTCCYLIIGAFGYAVMGSASEYLIDYVNMRRAHSNTTTVASLFLIGHVLPGLLLNSHVMVHMLRRRLQSLKALKEVERAYDNMDHSGACTVPAAAAGFQHIVSAEDSQTSRLHWFSITILVMGVTFVLSNILPSLGSLLSVLGATCGYTITFIFPALFALKLLPLSAQEKRLHLAVLFVAVVLMVFGSYATIKNLVEKITHAGTPFSC